MALASVANAVSKGATGLGRKAIQGTLAHPAVAINAIQSVPNMSRNMSNGDNLLTAGFKEVATTAAYYSNPGLMMAIQAAPAVYQGVKAARDYRTNKTQQLHDQRFNSYGRIGGGYMDTNRALTMRQAAVQQIQGNKMNARSALGGEARIFANNIY